LNGSHWRYTVLLAALTGTLGCRQQDPYCPGSLSSCPATVPVNGAPCTGTSPLGGCEYGDDPLHACDTTAVCTASGWSVQPEHDPSCSTTLGAACPATFVEAEATPTCSSGPTDYPICRYPEGVCECRPSNASFTCTPPARAGCPTNRPRSGTPCDGSCTNWGSGNCDNESMICACGVWQLVECTD
jgi:hypothetical protein